MTSCLDRTPAAAAPEARARVKDAGKPANDVEQLVRDTLPLVGHLVHEVLCRVPSHVARDELVSAGMYALTVSAQSFDPTLGVPFARFAALRIRGAITDELRTMDWASRGVRSKAREVATVRTQLTQTLGRSPTTEEVGHASGMSATELSHVASDLQRAAVLSLQALTTTDSAEEVLPARGDGPEATLLRREQLGYLRDAVAEMPDRLRMVIEQYFFQQRKLVDIARELGVTESRVSQLRSEALGVLRAAMRSFDGPPDAVPAPAGRRNDALAAYCAAVATRSTLAGRLAGTTLQGETRSGPAAGRSSAGRIATG